jgi:hypothetical protein
VTLLRQIEVGIVEEPNQRIASKFRATRIKAGRTAKKGLGKNRTGSCRDGAFDRWSSGEENRD